MSTVLPSRHPAADLELRRRKQKIEARLAQRAGELSSELDRQRHGPLGEERAGSGRDERASESELATVVDAEATRDLEELRQIDLALQRLGQGLYGVCADCGDPIAPARLEVQPAAIRCSACQRRAEATNPVRG